MIVRILGGGQFDVDDEHLEQFEELDAAMLAAIEDDDEEAFEAALEAVIEAVQTLGKPLDAKTIMPSDLAIPHEGATLAEVSELLASEEAAEG